MALTKTLIALTALASVAVWSPGCTREPAPPPTRQVTIATGGPGGAFYPIGLALADIYAASVPGLETDVESGGSSQNVQALESGHAQVAFTQADVAYLAYRQSTDTAGQPASAMRGIAVLWMNTVQVAVPYGSPVDDFSDLRGRRVSVGTPGSGTETLARIVLESYGLRYADLRPEFLSFVQTVDRMRAGRLDAAFVVAGMPTVALGELSENPGVRLLPIPRDHLRTMRGQYPFLQPQVVVGGTYTGVDDDVETVGVSSLLASRVDVDEELVYNLTRLLFDSLPTLRQAHPAAGLITLDEAPATPIPLHPGAARYYREREIFR